MMATLPNSQLLIHQTQDGLARLEVRLVGETDLLSQKQMAYLEGNT
jgi:hypothetical protein